MDLDRVIRLRNALITSLRVRGYAVNRTTTAYRTYVINLHNPNLRDPGKGHGRSPDGIALESTQPYPRT